MKSQIFHTKSATNNEIKNLRIVSPITIHVFNEGELNRVQVFENGKLLASWSAYTEAGKKQRIAIATELYPNAIFKTTKP